MKIISYLRNNFVVPWVVCCLLMSKPLLAEVMDKEPSLLQVWGTGLLSAFVGYALCRIRWYFIFPVTIVFFFLSPILEFFDPWIRQSIIREAGLSYVIQISLAAVLVLLACIVGGMGIRISQRR